MKIFISAGEPSGDLHGGNLARALQSRFPLIELVGFGGEQMAEAGVRLLYPLTQLAVMWIGRVLANLPTFFHLGAKAESFFRTQRPDAVILIDYPGFHFHIAQRAHRAGIPVYYFVPPQLWAWRGGRVKKIKKYFRAVLTALPFEEEWYRSRGVRTHYVGHPYFDELRRQQLDDAWLQNQARQPGRIVAILPGSRTQEVISNLELMLNSAEVIARQVPGTRFLIAAYKAKHAEIARNTVARRALNVEIFVGRTPEIIAACEACIAVSGSVGLELMVRRKPTIVVYKTGWLFHQLADRLMTCEYISLVNLLASKELYPEFAGHGDFTQGIAEQMVRWLQHPEQLQSVVEELDKLNSQVTVPGAIDRAADFLLQDIPSYKKVTS